MLTRKERASARGARGRTDECSTKQHTFTRHTIEIRRLDHIIDSPGAIDFRVDARVAPPIIRKGEKNIGPLLRFGGQRERQTCYEDNENLDEQRQSHTGMGLDGRGEKPATALIVSRKGGRVDATICDRINGQATRAVIFRCAYEIGKQSCASGPTRPSLPCFDLSSCRASLPSSHSRRTPPNAPQSQTSSLLRSTI